MNILETILRKLRLNDEEDDYDDGFLGDDEESFQEEPRPKKNFFKRAPRNSEEPLDDFDDPSDDEPIVRKFSRQPTKNVKTPVSGKSKSSATSSSPKVSPIRSRRNSSDMSVCVVKPKDMEDAREITETLLANCTVLLNMEGLDLDLAQRIIDFTAGSCYAINGNLQKVTNYIFIITPSAVDVSGDIQDILSGAFDVPPMNYNL